MTSVNNCPILVKTLKDLHVQNLNTEKEDLSNIKNLVKNDLVIVCTITNIRWIVSKIS
jgi:hypothetical protein